MASLTGNLVCVSALLSSNQATTTRSNGLNTVSVSTKRTSFPSLQSRQMPLRFRVSCAAEPAKSAKSAKPETVKKVCEIVRKQLALSDESEVSGQSKFASLGADSLDTVEIVMGLEEAFGISVEEESAASIETVQDAADMIENLITTDA